MSVRWNEQGDCSLDGEWVINSEQVRGEPRFFWLDNRPAWANAEADRLGIDIDGKTSRQGGAPKIRRNVERLLSLSSDTAHGEAGNRS